MILKTISDVLELVKAQKQCKTAAVAVPEDSHTLEAVLRAGAEGHVRPILVGNQERIRAVAREISQEEQLAKTEIVHVAEPLAAADRAVALVREGQADFLMKGSLNTAEILRAVLNKEHGLPHGKLVTDVAFTELPGYHKLLVFADGGIVPYPTLEQKAEMIRVIVQAMGRMGYGDDIKVGILCATEAPNPKIVESADAVELKRMNQAGEITGCIVEGPISLDIALRPEVARAKHFDSPVAGDADVLIMPNLVTGNVYSKSIEMIGAMPLGIVLGASCPIAVVSRAAPVELKYSALLLASAMTDAGKEK